MKFVFKLYLYRNKNRIKVSYSWYILNKFYNYLAKSDKMRDFINGLCGVGAKQQFP